MGLLAVSPPTFDMTTTETVPITFDLTSLLNLAGGETITVPTQRIFKLTNGVDVSAAALVGSPGIDNSAHTLQVVVQGSGLAANTTYRLVCGCTPIAGKIINWYLDINVIF